MVGCPSTAPCAGGHSPAPLRLKLEWRCLRARGWPRQTTGSEGVVFRQTGARTGAHRDRLDECPCQKRCSCLRWSGLQNRWACERPVGSNSTPVGNRPDRTWYLLNDHVLVSSDASASSTIWPGSKSPMSRRAARVRLAAPSPGARRTRSRSRQCPAPPRGIAVVRERERIDLHEFRNVPGRR